MKLSQLSALALSIFVATYPWEISEASSLEWISLPQEVYSAQALDISADGTTVVGHYSLKGQARNLVFKWTAASGFQPIDFGAAGIPNDVWAIGVNSNGSIITSRSNTTSRATRWSSATGLVEDLGSPSGFQYSSAYAVDSSGALIAGTAGNPGSQGVAVVRRNDSVFPIDKWTVIATRGTSYALSGDGSTVVGYWQNASNNSVAFRWTEAGGREDLPTLGGTTIAYGVNGDGSVIVGRADGPGTKAFRWTSSGGIVALDSRGGEAYDVNYSGSVVVGTLAGPPSIGGGFIWDNQNGLRKISEQLIADGITLAPTWFLAACRGISDSGTKVVGWGLGPQGIVQPYIVTFGPAVLTLSGVNIYRDESDIPTLEWASSSSTAFKVQYDDDLVPPWTDSANLPMSLNGNDWSWKDLEEGLPSKRFYRISWPTPE